MVTKKQKEEILTKFSELKQKMKSSLIGKDKGHKTITTAFVLYDKNGEHQLYNAVYNFRLADFTEIYFFEFDEKQGGNVRRSIKVSSNQLK